MFAQAINHVGGFTRPLLTISREFNSQNIVPGAATFFFVNDEGIAITCKHVAQLIIDADMSSKKFNDYKKERNDILSRPHTDQDLKQLEYKYNYHDGVIVEIKNNFLDCVDTIKELNCILHPEYDLAIIKLNGFNKKLYHNHAVFAKDGNSVAPGDYLCRLGFPFPEYTGYLYNAKNDSIEWDPKGKLTTPRFPLDGMITRHLIGRHNEIMGYELSSPGLRGHSGGPVFNNDGIIYGIQSRTKSLYLGFDINDKVMLNNGKTQEFRNQPFLHVGDCLHVNIIKNFLNENHIRYYVGDSLDNAELVELQAYTS